MRERHVKLFRSAGAQALAIPRELELAAESVILRREGARLIVEPAPEDKTEDWAEDKAGDKG